MSRASTPLNDPRYDSRWKMPGYTGHVNGLVETLGSTPVTAQRKAFYRNGTEMDPTGVVAVGMPNRDPLNKEGGMRKRTVPELIWPQVAQGNSGAIRKGENGSSLILGDQRFIQKVTHYQDTHVTPTLQASLWKPANNYKDHKYDLINMDPAERIALYERMFDKVGDVALQHIEDNLRLRFAAKLNTASNTNGFKLLKLFQNYDTQCIGTMEIHDFRKALNSYGLQLPVEVEICMFAKFDIDGNGTLDYKEFVSHFVEGEYLNLGFSSVKDAEIRQMELSKQDEMRMIYVKQQLSDRFRQLTGTDASTKIKDGFRDMDVDRSGAVSKGDFNTVMNGLNLRFSEPELECIYKVFEAGKGVSYSDFSDTLCVKPTETIMGRASYKRSMHRYFREVL